MNESKEKEIVFRPYVLEDRPFIESSWASSYYSACRIKDLLSPEEFHKFHRPLRDRFFNRSQATVIVACAPDDGNLILGWIAVEVLPNCSVLHYLYVKSLFRHEYGITRELILRALPPGPILFTHLTPRAAQLMAGKEQFRTWRYLPHLT